MMDEQNIIQVALASGAVCFGIYRYVKHSRRRNTIRAWAAENQFTRSKTQVRQTFMQVEPALQNAETVYVYEGFFRGCRAYIAEFRIGISRRAYVQSFVALERPASKPFVPSSGIFATGLKLRSLGQWSIATMDEMSLDPDGIVGLLESLS